MPFSHLYHQIFRMSQADSKVLVLRALAGVAGIGLAVACYRGFKSRQRAPCPGIYLTRSNEQGVMMVNSIGLHTGQIEVLERLEALISCVSELKDEIKSLKKALPALPEHVREELSGTRHSRTTPTRRKRSAGSLAEARMAGGRSSEEAESEGG